MPGAVTRCTLGWRVVCRTEDGQEFDLSLSDLDRRLRLGLRGGTWNMQRLLNEIARLYDVRAQAFYDGRLVLTSAAPRVR